MRRVGSADLFAAARARAAESDFFLAHDLATYASLTGLSHAELASAIGCEESTLDLVALCRSPDRDARFRGQVEAISRRFQIDANRLAAILREADVVPAFDSAAKADGWLAAARDRGDEDDDQR